MIRPTRLAAVGASFTVAAILCSTAAQAATFATYSQVGSRSNLTWLNPVIPAVTKVIPAVTKVIPAVTKVIPAVTRVVGGKVVIVTPARTVIVTPARTVIVTPAKTVIVTPAHDGPTGSLFSTAANSDVYGSAPVKFSFLSGPLGALGPIAAAFSFQGTAPAVAPAFSVASFLVQPGLSGVASFTYTGVVPLRVWSNTYLPGANLLTATLGGLDIAGARGGSSGGISASTDAGDLVTFTSDFLDFAHAVDRDVAFNLTTISPVLGASPGAALHSFKTSSGGAFSSTPAPIVTAVPEPGAWTLMLMGFGALGLVARQRRATGLTC